ncbi:uncharacterized protein PRCAT00000969001 [Priceomyces carsonii]|uniref:uncharacterized protein n=1 Tax=Priceomyces carsonii TaxID=28549 RepID=UPI002ED8B140|nr:unnamed protein product [Priceomyces carsonii]
MDPIGAKHTYLRRLVHKFQARRDIPFRKKFFVGYDLAGNTYWEFTPDGNMRRLRRKLEPFEPKLFKVDYFLEVPPQWLQWLRQTRPDPPSLEELVNDKIRQQKIKILAQQADERWQSEKERMEQENQIKLASELERSKSESKTYESKPESQNENKQVKEDIHKSDEQEHLSNTASDHLDNLNKDDQNPWKQAEISKDENPIESAKFNVRQR